MCSLLLLVHAIARCDTTSRLYGIGKAVPLKKISTNSHFRTQAELFNQKMSHNDIYLAGEEALVCLYGGQPGEKLDALRYRRFCKKTCTGNNCVQVHTLPPPRHQLQLVTTAIVCITKYINGMVTMKPTSTLKNGAGSESETVTPLK